MVKNVSIAVAKAIHSPIRTRVLEILLANEPLSVKAIAARMGKSPVPLYHHVKRLLDAGFVREAGTAGKGRDEEKLYGPVSRGFRILPEQQSASGRRDYAKLGAAHVRYALRRCVRAVEAGTAILSGPGRTATVRHLSLTLAPSRLKELNRDLDALIEKWAAAPADEGSNAVSVAIVMGPHDRQ